MSLVSVYNTGRVDLAANGTVVSGRSTAWLGAAIREGDTFWARGLSVRILRANNGNEIVLAHPWPGAALVDELYEVRYSTDSERALGAAQNVLAAIRSGSVTSLAGLEPAPNTIGYYTGYNSAALTSITELARGVLGAPDVAALQGIIGLLTQSNPLDTTADVVLKTGAFGLGSVTSPQLMNLDAFNTPAGFYKVDARSTLGTKPPSSDIADAVIILHPMPSQTMQVYLGMTELGRNFIRKSNSDGTWAPWRSIMMDFEFGAGPGSGLDADTLDGYQASDFMLAGDLGSGGSIMSVVLAGDGAGSGLDADLFHGQAPTYYRNAANLNAGFLAAARINPATTYTVGGLIAKTSIGIDTANTAGRALMTYDQATNTINYAFLNLPGNTLSPIRLRAAGIPIDPDHLTSKAYVDAAVSSVLDASPEAIASLNDFLETLENDPNFAANIPAAIASKLDITAYTATDVLNKIKTVDGIGSGLDAELFAGQNAAFYRNAGNLSAGTVPDARLPSSQTGKTFSGTTSVVVLNVETQIQGNAGDTALSPTYTFTGDTNTGMYRAGTDLLGFSTGGVERMRLSSAGISGVGTGLTALNASALESGTVPDARLPSTLLRNTVTVTAGDGLTGGGGLSGNVALAVNNTVVRTTRNLVGGSGISDIGNLSSDRTISVDGTVLRTTGAQTKTGTLTINNGELQIQAGSSVLRFRKADGATKGYINNADTSNGMSIRSYSADGTQSSDFHFWGHTGILQATAFQGDGSRLTALNAGALGSGTIPNGRMNGNYSFDSLTLSNKFTQLNSNSWDDAFEIRGNQPAIWFNQTDNANSAFIGVNGTALYVLTDRNSDHAYEDIALDVNLQGNYIRYFGDGLAFDKFTIVAGPGLTGGGNLNAASRELRIGKPTSITADSDNEVFATSHTHYISPATIGILIARANFGARGTIATLARVNRAIQTEPGDLVPGSQLRYASVVQTGAFLGFSFGGTPTGTWMAQGYGQTTQSNQHSVTTYKRVE